MPEHAKNVISRMFAFHPTIKVAHHAVKDSGLEDEDDIGDLVEDLCRPGKPHGDWIATFDLVEKEDALVLERMGEEGECGVECRTIAAACVPCALRRL